MLRASAQARRHVQDEHVAVVRQVSEDCGFGADDLRQVLFKAIGVKGHIAPDSDIVAFTLEFE